METLCELRLLRKEGIVFGSANGEQVECDILRVFFFSLSKSMSLLLSSWYGTHSALF